MSLETSGGTAQTQEPGRSRALVVCALLATTLLAGVLRFHALDAPSFWSDEMFQLRDAIGTNSPGYIETRWGLWLSGVDLTPLQPDGYADWRHQGVDEWNSRVAAATIGTLSVAILGGLTMLLLGRGPGLVAALLLALSTWHIEWSQSARFYAPMFLYYNASLLLYWLASRRDSLPLLLVSIACAALAVATKPTSLMLFGVFAADAALLFMRERRLPFGVAGLSVLAAGVAVVASVPLLEALAPDSSQREFAARNVGESPLRVVAFNLYLVSPLIVIAAGVALLTLWRERPREIIYPAAMAAVPLAAFALLASFVHVEFRYTFVGLFGWIALASLALTPAAGALRAASWNPGGVARWLPLVLVAVALVGSDLIYYGPAGGNRPRWRDAYETVREQRAPQDSVAGLAAWAGRYYLGDASLLTLRDHQAAPAVERRRTWFVVKQHQRDQFAGRAELIEAFPNRTAFPHDTIRIYRSEGS